MFVIPAKAGTQRKNGRAPASAGVTKLIIALAAIIFFAAPAAAQTFPELTGRVVDQANLLSPEQEIDLSSKSEALEAQTGRQFVVATVNSLEGRTIEDYGYRLGRHWGIGREGEDDGVILLVAPNEKRVRIETGYGAEGFLTDIVSGRIIRNDILPRFREGDMAGGIMAGAQAILGHMSLPEAEAQRRADQLAAAERREADSPGFIPVVLIVVIFFVIIAALAKGVGGQRYRRRRRRGGGISPWIILWGLSELSHASRRGRGGWGGGGGFGGWGGGGGGFGGFSGGGGSFGGGGASGGW